MMKQEIISPKKTRNPHGTLKTHVTPLLLHVLRNTRFHGTPVEEYWARLYFSTHAEIYFDEHKSNYTFIIFAQKCFLDPTRGVMGWGRVGTAFLRLFWCGNVWTRLH